jgi:predicted GNAT family acetyltransferase
LNNIKISFRPKQKHLDEIAEWIIDEIRIPIKNSGNWQSIISAYEDKTLIIATYKTKTVGFYTYSIFNSTISIGVAEVKLEFRGKGIGRILLEEIIKKHEKDINALYLFCSPESSQKIWKKLGFKYFPNNSTNDRTTKIEMYKIIKPFLKSRINNLKTDNEIIEIWNDEPHKTNDENPTWVWNLKFIKKTRILKNPIIHFGHYEWRIRWRKGNVVFKDCKYKYFNTQNNYYNYMLIENIPNK